MHYLDGIDFDEGRRTIFLLGTNYFDSDITRIFWALTGVFENGHLLCVGKEGPVMSHCAPINFTKCAFAEYLIDLI